LDDNSSDSELKNNGATVGITKLFNFSVGAGEEVSAGFSEGHKEAHNFSKSLEAFTISGRAHVNMEELS